MKVATITKGWHVIQAVANGPITYGLELTATRMPGEPRQGRHVWTVNDYTFKKYPDTIMSTLDLDLAGYQALWAELDAIMASHEPNVAHLQS